MKFLAMLVFGLLITSKAVAQPTDVQQPNINGSAPALELGSPFGQSFVPTVSDSLIGVTLAVVDNVGVADIQISLWHSDVSGTALLGEAITIGTITAAEINAFYTEAATPLYFPIYFDQSYSQTQGERLAFTIEGGGTLRFYHGAGSSYLDGRILGDATKDLTFTTVVPEPGIMALLMIGVPVLLFARFKRNDLTKCRSTTIEL